MADRQIDDDEGKPAMSDRLANPLDALLGYRLRRASMTMMSDAADVLKPLNLSVGEASLLILIGANPGVRQSDVGRALEIKRANLTPLLARMKGRGLVTDKPIDGRSLSLALTESGTALAASALDVVTESNHRLAGHLSRGELQALTALATLIR